MALDMPFHQLAQAFITILKQATDQDSPIRWTKLSTRKVDSFSIWQAMLDYSMDRDAVAKYLLERFYGASIAKLVFNVRNSPELLATAATTFAQNVLHDTPREHGSTTYGASFITMSKWILSDFLVPMKNDGGKTGSAELATEKASRSKTFKENLYLRDGRQCIATRRPDRTAQYPGTTPVRLQGAHIIPFSVAKRPVLREFLEVFTGHNRYEHGISRTNLDNSNINRVENGMLLQIDAHQDFDEYLWTLKIDKNQQGHPHVAVRVRHPNGDPVGLLSWDMEDGQTLLFGPNPPPESFCLLHNSIAHILWASGATKAIDEWMWEVECGSIPNPNTEMECEEDFRT